jgi:hypothetical protein
MSENSVAMAMLRTVRFNHVARFTFASRGVTFQTIGWTIPDLSKAFGSITLSTITILGRLPCDGFVPLTAGRCAYQAVAAHTRCVARLHPAEKRSIIITSPSS